MTREEAMEFIAQSVKSDVDMAKVAEAIQALQGKPCESKQVDIDRFKEILKNNPPIISVLEEEPQRAKGHLVSNQQDGEVKPFWERYRCSVCGEYAQENFNYCSRCGAELEGEEE